MPLVLHNHKKNLSFRRYQHTFNLQIKKSNVDDILVGGTYYGNLNNTNEVQVLVSVTGILNETT